MGSPNHNHAEGAPDQGSPSQRLHHHQADATNANDSNPREDESNSAETSKNIAHAQVPTKHYDSGPYSAKAYYNHHIHAASAAHPRQVDNASTTSAWQPRDCRHYHYRRDAAKKNNNPSPHRTTATHPATHHRV